MLSLFPSMSFGRISFACDRSIVTVKTSEREKRIEQSVSQRAQDPPLIGAENVVRIAGKKWVGKRCGTVAMLLETTCGTI